MNKWTFRLIGLLVIGVIAFFFRGWFSPVVPAVLLQPKPTAVAAGRQEHSAATPLPDGKNHSQDLQTVIRLTSLEGRDGVADAASTAADKPTQPAQDNAGQSSQNDDKQQNPPQRGGIWIQAGAFSNPDNADRRAEQLRKKSWPVEIEKAQVDGKTLHRIFVGPLATADVEPYIAILGKMGINARQVSR